MIEIRWQKTVSELITLNLIGSISLHTDVRIKEMDRVTAQLRAGMETSSLY
jgi:hypothetical protein